MWSGPRNLSTALMRSFENRRDTIVWDEPLYAYYLKESKKNHPLKNQIIDKYETNINELIKKMTNIDHKKNIFYQKHMTHHILEKTNINWIEKGINCFLIREPKDVLLSYIKKNKINNANDIGYPMQLKLFNILKKKGLKPIVINADNLSSNPKKILTILCRKLDIPFSNKMLSWPKGKRDTDGIWGEIWYNNVKKSTCFRKLEKKKDKIPKNYEEIYNKCLIIYKELSLYDISNET